MEEKKFTSIKEFGFDPIVIKKQNDELKDDIQKQVHIQRVFERVIELRHEILLIYRYYGFVLRKIKSIQGPFEDAIDKKALIKEIENHPKDFLTKFSIERITKRFEREKKQAANEVYYNSNDKVNKRYDNKESRLIILETLLDGLAGRNANEVLFNYRKELKEKIEECRQLLIWLFKEKSKYDYLNSFRIDGNDYNNIEGNNEFGLKKFKRNELQQNLKNYINEFKLKEGVTVPQAVVRRITKNLTKAGYDAKETSVAEALRKMGYVEGLRK